MLPRGAERPNGEFSSFRVARKDQMEIFHASARHGKTKWRFFMLPTFRRCSGLIQCVCYQCDARRNQQQNQGNEKVGLWL